MAKRIHYWI